MTDQEYQEFADFRMQKSKATMEEATLMIEHCRWNGAANRLYYVCFYATTALLIKHKIETLTHAGVKQMPGLHFIKSGIFDNEMSTIYKRLFHLRQTGDYEDFADLTQDDILNLAEPTESFIRKIESLVKC